MDDLKTDGCSAGMGGGIGLLAVGGGGVKVGLGVGGGDGDTGLSGGGAAIGTPIFLIGKFGGIFISGVRGLAVPPIAFSEGAGPLGLGGVMPLNGEGADEDGGLIDPGTGGFISSVIYDGLRDYS